MVVNMKKTQMNGRIDNLSSGQRVSTTDRPPFPDHPQLLHHSTLQFFLQTHRLDL
jgi:hypothetical protein